MPFSARRSRARRKSGSPIFQGTAALVGVAGLFIGFGRFAALVAAAAVRGHGLGHCMADPAGGGGMPEGGNLGRFDARGKVGALRLGSVGIPGIGCHLGLGGANGGIG